MALAPLLSAIFPCSFCERPNLEATTRGSNRTFLECFKEAGCFNWLSNANGLPVDSMSEEQHLIRLLLRNYKAAVRPMVSYGHLGGVSKGPPVIVRTTIVIKSIYSVDEVNMEFKTQLVLLQRWTDLRLRYAHLASPKPKVLHLNHDQIIWKPDTFFQNERYGHFHVVKNINTALKVKPDGEILHSVRFVMAFSCVMNLLKYPMDIQKCVIEFSSYAYTTDDIVYIWDDQSFVVDPAVNSVLPNMAIRSITNGTCSSKTNTGEYSCLRITLIFERSFSFFLMQLYIPTALLVAISCVSYWIDWRASAGRMLLTIITFLTLVTQNYSMTANLPPVSYAKALDVWIGACVIFVFASLVEYAFVNFMGLSREIEGRKLFCANQQRAYRSLFNKPLMVARRANGFMEKPCWSSDAKTSRLWRSENSIKAVNDQMPTEELRCVSTPTQYDVK
ncbi:Glutamate-gated chloride channel subunit beta [Trichuris trichiura]|uniref:Glutamate-gated chloride channel subunit beta n=1 Tax=Trichuris trichiura TaxID=36087 RepID=A0A077YZ06_TRITR|nr:Glutamate-gated chloride channel subunit beta [Trichuris trichiura]